jgi:hypothetical protein
MKWFDYCCYKRMHHHYQQLDLQTLIDLLAEETEKYTRAFVSGSSKENNQQRVIINELVEEILVRKRGAKLPNEDHRNSRVKDDFPCC